MMLAVDVYASKPTGTFSMPTSCLPTVTAIFLFKDPDTAVYLRNPDNPRYPVEFDWAQVTENGAVTLYDGKNLGESTFYEVWQTDSRAAGQYIRQGRAQVAAVEALPNSQDVQIVWLVRNRTAADTLQAIFIEQGIDIIVEYAP